MGSEVFVNTTLTEISVAVIVIPPVNTVHHINIDPYLIRSVTTWHHLLLYFSLFKLV